MSAGIILRGAPQFVRGVRASEVPWRTFEVTTRLAVTEAVGAIRAWAGEAGRSLIRCPTLP